MGFKAYVQDVADELLHKVSWPTWKELQASAIIVMITSVIISLIVWVMDFVFGIWPAGDGGLWKGMLGFFYEMFNSSK